MKQVGSIYGFGDYEDLATLVGLLSTHGFHVTPPKSVDEIWNPARGQMEDVEQREIYDSGVLAGYISGDPWELRVYDKINQGGLDLDGSRLKILLEAGRGFIETLKSYSPE